MVRQHLGNMIPGHYTSVVLGARLDLLIFIQKFGITPPAMFKDAGALEEWLRINDFGCEKVNGSVGNIVRVFGDFKFGAARVGYNQLWARADYKNYRKPWASFHRNADDVVGSMQTLHADHVINKERILPNFPEAWVMLFPVAGGSNSPFGAVEHNLPDLTEEDIDEDGSYAIDPLVGFKIFSSEYPRDQPELDEQLRALDGQVAPWFYEKVVAAIVSVWKPQPKK